ncbi:MAG: adenylate/guanylate cyclase domain-containing protein [Deltaproteobacteria bacterium]|nr:adenylate/guanylate cyclase domain-containing protein [Deltaproteobacteria bacterium]
MPTANVERKLTAILSADVKGYSRLMGEDEEATIRTLTAYRAAMATLIQQHRGRVVDSPGDNLLAEFVSVVDAVRCAVEIQHDLKVRNAELPDQRKMEFRLGINLGDVVVEGERIYGDGVNIAARLESLAEPGGICLSGTVYEQVEPKLALGYEYLGEQTVKNIAKPVRVWRVVMDEAAAALAATQSVLRQASPETHERGTTHRVRVTWPKGAVVLMSFLLLVGIIVSVQYLSFRLPTPSAKIPDKPSIAVLPFVNLSEDPQEAFGYGMTVDLVTDLSKLSGLIVIALHSIVTYKGKAVQVQEVSQELGARYVLEGSVRKVGDRVLITAQLSDGTTGGYVWAERYDRPFQDLYAVQEEVRRKILVHIGLKLRPEEEERLQRTYTRNFEAYTDAARAFELLGCLTPTDYAQAQQLLEKAIALDPSYAVAYAFLGLSYWIEWFLWSDDPQLLERAFALAQQALALDDSHPSAHELLGLVYLWRNKQHEQALAEEKRAVAYSPNWFSSNTMLGYVLNFAGRPEEAIANAEQVLRLSPRTEDYLPVLAQAYVLTGRYEEAIATYQKILTFIPHHPTAHLGLAGIYSELGREEEARAEAAEVLRLNPNFSLEALRPRFPYKDPAVLERQLAAWRKAGLK